MPIQENFADVLNRLGAPVASGNQSASARTLDSLRRRIISLELPPETVLSRSELAREYKISQTPLRDALQKLEAEGLVDIYPQSKTLVTRIDSGQIHEAHFLRLAVEVEVVRILAKTADDATIARLRTIVAMQEALAENPDEMGAFQDLDEVFHQAMMSAAGQAGLHGLIRAQSGHLNRVRRLDMPDNQKIRRILDGHKRIIAALEAHDPDEAVAAIREHLSQTVSRIEILRAQYPEYFRPVAQAD
ncbi:GntR family transcriptional regulator [Actibacterium lipolyticum]|uniref:Putative HTH-type transcriptional regulator YdfH n=1 Tax=Actibacterium lipolyticum TaxID=1524263 RepID=A0A238L8A9_9RHOB|nr:GntR family transcriptional regulator [Actibacterium lipolyticum]SMX51071.1 putative HTH-type transcriptional regulator YdfH [Actibacterium lipolyticum]